MFDAEFIVAPTCLMLDRCRWQEQLKMEIEIDFYNKIFLQESWNKKTERFLRALQRESLARYFEEED